MWSLSDTFSTWTRRRWTFSSSGKSWSFAVSQWSLFSLLQRQLRKLFSILRQYWHFFAIRQVWHFVTQKLLLGKPIIVLWQRLVLLWRLFMSIIRPTMSQT